MLSRSFFPNFGQGPFPKIAGKSSGVFYKYMNKLEMCTGDTHTQLMHKMAHSVINNKIFSPRTITLWTIVWYGSLWNLSVRSSKSNQVFIMVQLSFDFVIYLFNLLMGCRFEPHQRHWVMSLSKTIYPLLGTGSIQDDPSRHDWKIVDWGVKNLNKQNQPAYFATAFMNIQCTQD